MSKKLASAAALEQRLNALEQQEWASESEEELVSDADNEDEEDEEGGPRYAPKTLLFKASNEFFHNPTSFCQHLLLVLSPFTSLVA